MGPLHLGQMSLGCLFQGVFVLHLDVRNSSPLCMAYCPRCRLASQGALLMRDVPEEAGAMSRQGTRRESRFCEGSKASSQAPHPSSGREPPAHRGEGPSLRAGPSAGAGPGWAGQARRPWGSRAVLAPLGPEPSKSFLKASSASGASPPFPGLGPSAGAAGGPAPAPAIHRPCATHPAPSLCSFGFSRVSAAAQGG